MIRLVVVDDQDLVRDGLRALLDAEPDLEVVGTAGDGEAAVATVLETRPDVVVMDIRMPRLDGIAATRRLQQLASPARVLALTTFDLDDLVYDALAAGASGFLLKDVRAADLAAAVRTVAAGDELLAPSVTRRLIAHFVRTAPRGPGAARTLQVLTPREREVLVLVARGLSNAEIATAEHVSEATVKTHISRIFAKLELRDRAQAVIAAYEAGLVTAGTGAD
ncbi:LuxR family two component transcriptional regulator [Motilibacter rhizosphaerae]|uniref:LuxR family two component transcriptional regulator n=1 Tax=Motilibacter rhizosphaerae TaxID=598652 RepID=A0A4Q7NQ49_9ACTN|nr:response regulator transcription factor [Motilibacter rhizosphaerae]RZS87455.1 LuxR family two component transcriptional regulator [Motilibacter rhizosphaerae]